MRFSGTTVRKQCGKQIGHILEDQMLFINEPVGGLQLIGKIRFVDGGGDDDRDVRQYLSDLMENVESVLRIADDDIQYDDVKKRQ